MANFAHNDDCDCKDDHPAQGGGQMRAHGLRWILCGLFILVSFYFLRPFFIQQMVTRAQTYTSYVLYDDAVRLCRKAFLLDKNNADIYVALGTVYFTQYDYAQAKTAFQEAVRLDPKNSLAQFDLGLIYSTEKNFKAALACYNVVAESGPENLRQSALIMISRAKQAQAL